MTKAEIVQAVYSQLGGFSKKESADLVDLVFEMMKETLGRGEKIKISGFGNFVLRDKRRRQGRNPQTGDPIVITERRVLNFKASQILKHALNTARPGDGVRTGDGIRTGDGVRTGDGLRGGDGVRGGDSIRAGDGRGLSMQSPGMSGMNGDMKVEGARGEGGRSDEAVAVSRE
jgi:integration host factor subunit alpha